MSLEEKRKHLSHRDSERLYYVQIANQNSAHFTLLTLTTFHGFKCTNHVFIFHQHKHVQRTFSNIHDSILKITFRITIKKTHSQAANGLMILFLQQAYT
jgi:hypothetical protein